MTNLPKVVTRRLHTAAHAAHPDPDVIAAFVEKSLSDRERDQLLQHLAECRVCRDVVALSIPEQAVAAPLAASVRRPTWLTWPVLRWGALGACVLVVGTAVSLRQYRSTTSSRLSEDKTLAVSQASERPAVVQSDLKTLEKSKALAPQPSEAKQEMAAAAKRDQSRRKEPVEGSLAAKNEEAPAVAAERRDQPRTFAQPETVVVNNAPQPAMPSLNALDEAVPGRAKDALQQSTPNAAMGATIARQAAAAAPSALVANKKALATSAELIPRWTLSADGTLQRSLDSGRTWETIPVDSSASFRALAADGFEIWVGGAKGALYHSSDAGQTWTHVQPAANGEVLAGDIVRVEFTDRLHGTVSTSAPEKWLTADGGQTWEKQ